MWFTKTVPVFRVELAKELGTQDVPVTIVGVELLLEYINKRARSDHKFYKEYWYNLHKEKYDEEVVLVEQKFHARLLEYEQTNVLLTDQIEVLTRRLSYLKEQYATQ